MWNPIGKELDYILNENLSLVYNNFMVDSMNIKLFYSQITTTEITTNTKTMTTLTNDTIKTIFSNMSRDQKTLLFELLKAQVELDGRMLQATDAFANLLAPLNLTVDQCGSNILATLKNLMFRSRRVLRADMRNHGHNKDGF